MRHNQTPKWFCQSCKTWKTERINLKCDACRNPQQDHGDECTCPQCMKGKTDA